MSHPPDADQPVSHYPVLLRLAGRPAVVVGGGEVAEEKVAGLLAARALVTVVAPSVTRRLSSWGEAGRVALLRRPYRDGDLDGAFLAIAATDPAEASRVWEEAERRGLPVNSADDPDRCSFILPAVHRDGELVVAVSTGGRAPALAVRIRDRIARLLGSGYAEYLDLLGSRRTEIAARFDTFSKRREVWYRLVDSPALELVRAGDVQGARRVLEELIGRAAREGDPT